MSLAPAARPCGTCPYRRDCPSGLWHDSECVKLAQYDGETWEQPMGLFMCHTRPEQLCSGWVGCHDMDEALAVRLHARSLDLDAVLAYISPVALFASGAEAAAHGMREILAPGPRATREIHRLIRRAKRRTGEET